MARALKAELFHFPCKSFHSGAMLEFGWVLLASQLMYFETMYDTYGTDHPVPVKILRSAEKVGLDFSTIKEWGRDVRELWIEENNSTICSSQMEYAISAKGINEKLGTFSCTYEVH